MGNAKWEPAAPSFFLLLPPHSPTPPRPHAPDTPHRPQCPAPRSAFRVPSSPLLDEHAPPRLSIGSMKIQQPHSLSQEEATERMKSLTLYWDTKYGTRTTWDQHTAHIKGRVRGIKFDGTFRVEQHQLFGDIKVGFLAERIGGRGYVERKLQQYFDPNTSLETLQAKI